MAEMQQVDRSFRGWYGRTMGKWWIISQVIAWIFCYPIIPLIWLIWRGAGSSNDWLKKFREEHPTLPAESSRGRGWIWVKPTFTKRGRLRRGYFRRK